MRACQVQASADLSEGAAPAASQATATEQRPQVDPTDSPSLRISTGVHTDLLDAA